MNTFESNLKENNNTSSDEEEEDEEAKVCIFITIFKFNLLIIILCQLLGCLGIDWWCWEKFF